MSLRPRIAALALAACLVAPLAADEAAPQDARSAQVEALVQQGLAQERLEHLEDAAGLYRQALAQDPGCALALRELGRCELKLGWKELAVEHFQAYQDAADEDDEQVDKTLDYLKAQGARLGALPLAQSGAFGLGLELGYAWGFTNSSFGHNFNENGNGDLLTYTYSPGEGVSALLEASYRVSPGLTLGVAAMPLNTDVVGAETLVEGVAGGVTTTADSTSVRQFCLPLLLRVHTGAQVGKLVRLTSFVGAGVVFTQPYVETSTNKTSDSTGNYTTTSRYQRDLQDGMAFQAGLGAQIKLSPRCLLYLNGSLLLAHMPATGAMASLSTVDDATGKVVATSEANVSYVSSPPLAVTGATASGFSGPASARVSTYDDGPEQYTLTKNTTGPEVTRDFSETQQLSSVTGNDDLNIKALALNAGLRWEF